MNIPHDSYTKFNEYTNCAFNFIQNLILLTKKTSDEGKDVFKKRQMLEILAGVNPQLGGIHGLKITLF